MKTSYYAIAAKEPGAIAISRKLPHWLPRDFPRYRPLAPGDWHRSITEGQYVQRYHSILATMQPIIVWNLLHEMVYPHEPILVCYEKSGDFCHRRIVAEWFRYWLNQEVPELTIQGIREREAGSKQLVLF